MIDFLMILLIKGEINMSIKLMCHNFLCCHEEDYSEDLKFCPICGDELVKVVIDEDEEFVYDWV